jgi:nitroreductase
MELAEAIRTRRTHKAYRPESVPQEDLAEILELARWAPNHHLTNPWRFRVVGTEALERLKRAAGPEAAPKLDRAPTLIAASVAPDPDDPDDEIRAREDEHAAACAVYIVLLAAHARGYAAYWRTPGVLRTEAGLEALGIGPGERALGLIYVGRPIQEQRAPEREDPASYVSWLD